MNKNKSKSSNGSCLMTCLKGLGIFCLLGVFLVFGWIAGLIWLIFFRKKTAPEKQKRNTILISTASIFSFIFFLYGMFFAPPTPTELTISCQEESELDIDTDYIITLDYGPEDADISSVSCDTDNISIADIERDNNDSTKFILHTKSSGTINITANSGSIESNTLTFHIVDKEQQALLEEQEKLVKELEVQENETIVEEETETVEEETETVEKETESIDEEETKTIVEKEKTVQENVGKKNQPKKLKQKLRKLKL
ncbi:MAG: hypothetical protein J6B68_11135 [Lachnospiraceae bacterium]|nr:hypothetical protein [Lachnospiraceae bacterium]